MARDARRGRTTAGRHRSPWGRSGRILPIRWGRIVAIGMTLLLVTSAGVWLRVRAAGPTGSPAGQPNAAVTLPTGSSQGQAPGGGPTSGPSEIPALTMALDTANAPTTPPAVSATGPVGTAPTPVPTASEATTRGGQVSLIASPKVVDFGSVNSSATLNLRNPGTGSVDFAIGATPLWLAVTPSSGTVPAGGLRSVTLVLDRSAAPAGLVDIPVTFSAHGGAGQAGGIGEIRVTAVVSGPPVIDLVEAVPNVVRPSGCPSEFGPTLSIVSVRVTDSTGVFRVDLLARLPDGRTTTTVLALDNAAGNQSVWSGPVGPSAVAGRLSFTVTAADVDGLRSQADGSLEVGPCPAPPG